MWDLFKKRDLLRRDIRFDCNNRIARLSTNISWALEYDLLMVKINELRAIDHKITAAWKEKEQKPAAATDEALREQQEMLDCNKRFTDYCNRPTRFNHPPGFRLGFGLIPRKEAPKQSQDKPLEN